MVSLSDCQTFNRWDVQNPHPRGPWRARDAPFRHTGAVTLDEHLDAIVTARDREDMQPTIDALLPLHREHPRHPRVLYEVGGAYDTAGDEATAVVYYERALAAGLTGDELRRCCLQYGSTLRNLGELTRSAEVFARARRDFPHSPSLAVFEAITLHAAGRDHEAVGTLLEVIADEVPSVDLERYRPALRGNAEHLRALGRADAAN